MHHADRAHHCRARRARRLRPQHPTRSTRAGAVARRLALPLGAGSAEVLADDDALARQRDIIRWHPLRALNAIKVRVLGADLLTVRVRLDMPPDAATW
jgi:hypothetical protein